MASTARCLIHRPDLLQVGERIVRVPPWLRIVEVEHRLRDAKKEQSNSDTCRKQHGEPGEIAEFRPAVVVTKLDPPVAAEHQIETDKQHDDQGR